MNDDLNACYWLETILTEFHLDIENSIMISQLALN